MNVLDAARAVARHYPGGAAALGARMGKTNLADELNPNLPRSKLGAADLVELMVLADDYRPLYAMAMETRHYPPVPMPPPVEGAAQPCMVTLGQLLKETADVVATVSQDVADGVVTDVEMARAAHEVCELVQCAQRLMQQLRAMNEAYRAQQAAPRA